jgi:protein-S-isoprenylcysteine O-methyltransferase
MYWLIAARINNQTSFSSEIFSFVKLIGSAILVYLPILTNGTLASRLAQQNIWSDIAGTAIVAIGVFLAIWARSLLGRNWSGKVMLQDSHRLITEGPYRFVRHPIYLGGLLAMFGSCLVLGQVFGFAYSIYSTFGLAMKSRQEDELLERQFPDEFREYKQQVKMLLPYIY